MKSTSKRSFLFLWCCDHCVNFGIRASPRVGPKGVDQYTGASYDIFCLAECFAFSYLDYTVLNSPCNKQYIHYTCLLTLMKTKTHKSIFIIKKYVLVLLIFLNNCVVKAQYDLEWYQICSLKKFFLIHCSSDIWELKCTGLLAV